VWIWNIHRDRFPWALEILDFSHASGHLRAVANELYGEGTDEARRWVEPLLHQLRHGGQTSVIQTLRDLVEVVKPGWSQNLLERETHNGAIL